MVPESLKLEFSPGEITNFRFANLHFGSTTNIKFVFLRTADWVNVAGLETKSVTLFERINSFQTKKLMSCPIIMYYACYTI